MPAKPSFRARHARYEIDQCEPQTRAIRSGKIDFHALTKGHYPGTRMPDNVLPGVSSMGYWSAGGAQDWGLDAHRNEGVEFMFLETGMMDLVVDQQQFKLPPGSFTITRPWQLHKLGAPNIGPGRLHWLILDVGVRRPHQEWRWPDWAVLTPEDLDELTHKLRHNENCVWSATPAVRQAFAELARNIAAWPQPHMVSRLTATLNQLLVGVLDALAEQPPNEDAQLTSHQRSVELFLRDLESARLNLGEPWTLGRMARHCGMGITALSKYCRQLVNAGPMEYLNQCRLDHAARELVQHPERSVTDVAFSFGFNSSQYFATVFRKRHRLAPSDYQARRPPVKSAA